MLVHHSEASYEIKRYLIEKAKLHWKELKDINTNSILQNASVKQKALDHKLEEQICSQMDWKRGEQFVDKNVQITYNTFLEQDDPRLKQQ